MSYEGSEASPHPHSNTFACTRLAHMSKCIYVHFEGAKWQIADLEVGVYPVKPKALLWTIHRALGVQARRYGFQLVPDLAGKAHMYPPTPST